ncbi:MAG: ABC transporter permease, partial [Aquaspirillum sp.]
MQFIWTVAWRLLREGRFQSVLILSGVTLGVAVVVYITAIVNGLQANLINKTLSTQAHIVLRPADEDNRAVVNQPWVLSDVQKRTQRERTLRDWTTSRDLALATPGVKHSAALASGPAFAVKGGVRKSVSLMGV